MKVPRKGAVGILKSVSKTVGLHVAAGTKGSNTEKPKLKLLSATQIITKPGWEAAPVTKYGIFCNADPRPSNEE